MKFIQFALFVNIMTACVPAQTTIPRSVALVQVCVDASTFGAVSNDDIDDSAALRAFDESLIACLLVSGRLDFDTPQSTATKRRPYAMIRLHSGKKIIGDYASSELNFRGDVQMTDWHGVEVVGDDVTIQGLKFRTVDLTNMSEQTHQIWGIGPLRHPTVRSNVFEHPCHIGFKSGDNVEFFGYADRMIYDLVVEDNESLSSCRSFLASHSGVDGATVTGNVTHDCRGQDFDLEGGDLHLNWVIARNTLQTGPHSIGNNAIQMAGASNLVFAQNKLLGRGVNFYSCDNCTLVGNVIENTTLLGGSTPTIEVVKASNHFRMLDNQVSRRGDLTPGVLLHIGPHGTGQPADVLLSDNRFVQGTSSSVIVTEGIVGLTHLGGSVAYGGSEVNKYYGVIVNGTPLTRTDKLLVSGVTFLGPLKGAIGLSGSYAGGGRSVFVDNMMDATVSHGLMCGNVALGNQILGPVVQIVEQLTKNDCGPVGFMRIMP